MGLDLALGVIILIAAFRGWFQGFITPGDSPRSLWSPPCTRRFGVRDYAKPYSCRYLSTIQPDLVDRLLWWVSCGPGLPRFWSGWRCSSSR